MDEVAVDDNQGSSSNLDRNKVFLVIIWRGLIKGNPIFTSDESSDKTIYNTETMNFVIAFYFHISMIEKGESLLCDPGIAQRQPLVMVASSRANHSAVQVGGSV